MADDKDWATACRCGDKAVVVQPEAVIGIYAVHPTLRLSAATGPGYTVTHRPSGLAIWKVTEFAEAVRVAEWLTENKLIPEGEQEALAWATQMTPQDRTEVVSRLTAIAPRRV